MKSVVAVPSALCESTRVFRRRERDALQSMRCLVIPDGKRYEIYTL